VARLWIGSLWRGGLLATLVALSAPIRHL